MGGKHVFDLLSTSHMSRLVACLITHDTIRSRIPARSTPESQVRIDKQRVYNYTGSMSAKHSSALYNNFATPSMGSVGATCPLCDVDLSLFVGEVFDSLFDPYTRKGRTFGVFVFMLNVRLFICVP